MNNPIIKIQDLNAPDLDIFARYSEVQLLRINEPNPGIFIAESPKVIERAYNAGYQPISFLMEEKHIEGECATLLERCPDTPVYTASFDILTKLTGFKLTRGALCAFQRKPMPSIEEICKNKNRIVILEDVVNPTNVGAIFRSAAALFMDGIVLTSGCSNPLYRRAARVSMGTVFQIPWTILCEKGNGISQSTQETLKELGYKTVAMALTDQSISIDDAKLTSEEKLAIFLGTEGDGLQISTIQHCDYTVKIPMSHEVDSLNVAAASAVAFWELGKKNQ